MLMDAKLLNPKMLSMFGQGGAMFGVALNEVIKEHPEIIVLSSDMSTPAGLDKFKAAYPENFINMGIAEQNMIGTAAGLCDEGYKTISVAQACFLSMRSFEQIRQYVGYMKTNQILVGIGSGFSLGMMGNTHYAIEDMALMRMIPNMTVVAPCDALEAAKLLESAVEYNQPIYIRLFGGTGTAVVHNSDIDFKIGKAIPLREGRDVQIIATGSMVHNALKAAELLQEEGISASVVDMHTVKPIDESAIGRDYKLIVTVEEHLPNGGLGDAVGAVLLTRDSHPKLLKLGITKPFTEVGNADYLQEYNGLSPQGIKDSIINILS